MLANVRLSRLLLLLLFLLTFLLAAILMHGSLSSSSSSSSSSSKSLDDDDDVLAGLNLASTGDLDADIARKTLGLVDFNHLSGPEIRRRIEELLRIKQSVQTELRELERRRKEMQTQISAFHRKIEELRGDATREQAEMERLRASVQQARLELEEYGERNTPEVRAPLILPALPPKDRLMEVASSSSSSTGRCTMWDCFDYSKCSIASKFQVFVYDSDKHGRHFLEDDLKALVTSDPDSACVFLVITEGDSSSSLSQLIPSLPHWDEDGRNHLILDLSSKATILATTKHRAMVASSSFSADGFRPNFDLTLSSYHSKSGSANEDSLWSVTSSLLPVHRKFLISFQGRSPNPSDSDLKALRLLQKINGDKTDDKASVETSCKEGDDKDDDVNDDWSLCGSVEDRLALLRQSTFSLLITSPSSSSTPSFQQRLTESLQAGSIPVILGVRDSQSSLPFSEVIDWTKASVSQPMARITELHFLLRSFTDADLFSLRRQGNLVFKTFLSSPVKTALHLVRERLTIPPNPYLDLPSISVFTNSSPPLMMDMDQLPPDLEPREPLGPLEQPRSSVPFRRNFSTLLLDRYQRWNERFDPFLLPPYSPFEPTLPTDAKFLGSSSGFRPIGGGSGGAGKEFSQAVGGNVQSEQFTVVILTYEREEVLVDSLVRLNGLPFLNKVVVVWNSPDNPPSPDLRWPDLGVPIVVVKTEKNSLNNRFLPFDAIETEAVLSVDDDAHLRHDEIVFGFRVWRENRDRLVGFPGRFHAWDVDHNSWNYNSNYSCELSMVLTGAAFFHKYYSYAYTYLMPRAVRDMVDEFTNCEDLAMNFLISHMTRRPPVKVTSRWTFRCPGCPVVLSEEDSHFQERHRCINFFAEVFGYMPLMYTQFRADSVLFKTRIPQDKQKCFKFI